MHVNDFLSAGRAIGVAPLLVGTIAKGSVIFAVGAVCALVARGASAATRHMIWTLTLTGALAAPVISVFMPHWNVPVPQWSLPDVPAVSAEVIVPPALNGASSNIVFSLAPRTSGDASSMDPSPPPRADVRHPTPRPATMASVATAPAVATDAPFAAGVVADSSLSEMAPSPYMVASSTVGTTRDRLPTPVVATALIAVASVWPSILRWLVALWAVGAVVAIVPCVAGMARLSSVARRARPMRGGRWALLVPSAMRELGVRRHVRFVESDEPVMPMTWGVFRPIVLLPADDFDSTIEQRLDVLRHELAHVRRYDCLTQLIAQLACAVHWFNPLGWLASAQLRTERERACDDEVLRAGSKASDYADYLLRVARSTRLVGAAASGGLAMARPSQMAGRLLAVLDDRRRRDRVSVFATARATLIGAIVVAGIASLSPVPANARPTLQRPSSPAVATTTLNEGVPAASPVRAVAAMAAISPVVAHVSSIVSIGDGATAVLLPAATLSAVVPAVAQGRTAGAEPCDHAARPGEEHSHSNSISSTNGSKRWRVIWSDGDCSFEIDARGDFKWNRDATDIESISSGGSFIIEQHLGDDTKRLVIRPRADGTLERTYSVNGAKQEYDAAARAWFAEALVALERETAFAADQRVPAILERGGVDAVLKEVSLLGSDYARRRYYTALLSNRQLDRAQVRRVVEQAGSEMSSDYELAELLVVLAKLDAFGDDSHTAFVAAAKKIGSDYERRRALNALLQRDRLAPATVQALLEAATTIGSDYELAELLIDVSKRYAMNEQTRPVYIKAVGSIGSDYEHRRVLAAIVDGGGLTPVVTRTLLDDARRIGSDYELAEFLIQVAKKGALDASTRDAYFAAADRIGSDYEHHRALSQLLTRDLLTKDLAKAILTSAAKIDSDYECATLLVEVANAIQIDDDLRPSFERAAGTIQSESEYGRAMNAVRRSAAR